MISDVYVGTHVCYRKQLFESVYVIRFGQLYRYILDKRVVSEDFFFLVRRALTDKCLKWTHTKR